MRVRLTERPGERREKVARSAEDDYGIEVNEEVGGGEANAVTQDSCADIRGVSKIDATCYGHVVLSQDI